MKRYLVEPGTRINLNDWDPNETSAFDGDKAEAKDHLDGLNKRLEDLQELLGTSLPDEGSETLAGLIYEAAGKVPEPGEQVTIADLAVTVEKVADQRILKVKITAPKPLLGHARHERDNTHGDES